MFVCMMYAWGQGVDVPLLQKVATRVALGALARDTVSLERVRVCALAYETEYRASGVLAFLQETATGAATGGAVEALAARLLQAPAYEVRCGAAATLTRIAQSSYAARVDWTAVVRLVVPCVRAESDAGALRRLYRLLRHLWLLSQGIWPRAAPGRRRKPTEEATQLLEVDPLSVEAFEAAGRAVYGGGEPLSELVVAQLRGASLWEHVKTVAVEEGPVKTRVQACALLGLLVRACI